MRSKLLTIEEIADWIRINKFTVYRMAERGELPGIKVARQWRFKEGDIEKWLERQKKSGHNRRKRT